MKLFHTLFITVAAIGLCTTTFADTASQGYDVPMIQVDQSATDADTNANATDNMNPANTTTTSSDTSSANATANANNNDTAADTTTSNANATSTQSSKSTNNNKANNANSTKPVEGASKAATNNRNINSRNHNNAASTRNTTARNQNATSNRHTIARNNQNSSYQASQLADNSDVTRAANNTKATATTVSGFPQTVDQLNNAIRDYLVSNPQVLAEAAQALNKQEMDQMTSKAVDAAKQNAKDLLNDPDSPVLGNPKGSVTLIEFMDYQCIHCKNAAPIIEQLVKSNPNLRVVIKELPILGPNSVAAAKAALAIYQVKQQQYGKVHLALFAASKNESLSASAIAQIVHAAGFSSSAFNKVLKADSQKFENEIKANYQLAGKLFIRGTPSFIALSSNGAKAAVHYGAVQDPSDLTSLIASVG